MKQYRSFPARSGSRFVLCAWLALAATFFSAVSPALAAAILGDRPEALGRMLGLPAPAHDHGEHAHHSHEGHAANHDASPADEGAAHAAHGIYCSLCLNTSSTLTLPGIAPAIVSAELAGFALTSHHPVAAASVVLLGYAARAPPPGSETA